MTVNFSPALPRQVHSWVGSHTTMNLPEHGAQCWLLSSIIPTALTSGTSGEHTGMGSDVRGC